MRVLSFLVGLLWAGSAFASGPSFAVTVRGTGAPVILIPDVACGADIWKATVDKLSLDHTCYALTLPGFAGQPAIKPPLLDQLKTELEQYIAEKKLDHPVLIGNGFGGLLALQVAAEKPESVGALVLVDTTPALSQLNNPTAPIADALNAAGAVRKLYSAFSPAQFSAANTQGLTVQVTEADKASWIIDMENKSAAPAVGEALAELIMADARPLLPQIPLRTLVVIAGGPTQNQTKMDRFEDQYKGLSQRQLKVIPKARHFIMVDQPELFWSALADFLSQLPPRR